jgi:hypothetical protein
MNTNLHADFFGAEKRAKAHIRNSCFQNTSYKPNLNLRPPEAHSDTIMQKLHFRLLYLEGSLLILHLMYK